MKRASCILGTILLAVILGCGNHKQSTDGIITVDVTKSYPQKELILQDFLDVEYILPDDTNDEFTTSGLIHYVGKENILVSNRRGGDIFIFDRNGIGLRKINRTGQGPEDYTLLLRVLLDEDHNELYVNVALSNKILVYDLFGKFKRSIGGNMYISPIANFDQDHLIGCGDIESPGFDQGINRFLIISKQDGSVVKEIPIPYKEKKRHFVSDRSGRIIADGPPRHQLFIPCHDHWVLTEISSDTIYRLMSDFRLIPFIIRTPPVQSMDPDVFLYPSVLTDRYYFMHTTEKTPIRTETGITYPMRDLMFDRQEQALFEYIVYNGDFTTKKIVNLAFEGNFTPFFNQEIAFVNKFESYELVEAYGKGELKGKLKEIAAKLNEESNPVIMVAKYKK